MLNSNSKKVRESVRDYILGNLDFSGYIGYEGYPKEEPETWEDRVFLCRDIFRDEYANAYNLQRYGGEFNCFREWLCGLPSAMTVAFTYHEARQLVCKWLEETEEEANRYDDGEVWDKYLYLITREFFAMVDKAEKEKEKKAV